MELLQHGLVTIVAFGAAAFVIRRVFVTLKPTKGRSACASCEAGPRPVSAGGDGPSGRPRGAAPTRTTLSS